jgi:hypothetical protein
MIQKDTSVRVAKPEFVGIVRIIRQQVDQQIPIGLCPQQGLEDAVNLGINGMAHGASVDRRGRYDKRRGLGGPHPAGGTGGSAESPARTAFRAELTDARSASGTRQGFLWNRELMTLPRFGACCQVLQSHA